MCVYVISGPSGGLRQLLLLRIVVALLFEVSSVHSVAQWLFFSLHFFLFAPFLALYVSCLSAVTKAAAVFQ